MQNMQNVNTKKGNKISLNNCWLRQLREISWRQKTCTKYSARFYIQKCKIQKR